MRTAKPLRIEILKSCDALIRADLICLFDINLAEILQLKKKDFDGVAVGFSQ